MSYIFKYLHIVEYLRTYFLTFLAAVEIRKRGIAKSWEYHVLRGKI